MRENCLKVVENIKNILASSNLNLREIFSRIDKDGSGDISNLEFRQACRKL